MGFGQAHDAEAGAEALLGVRLGLQDQVDERARARPDPLRLPSDLTGCPSGIPAMARGHVLGHGRVLAVAGGAHVGGNPLAVMEDLDRARRYARPELLLQQPVRDRVIVLADLDVVVEPDFAFDPLGVLVGLGG